MFKRFITHSLNILTLFSISISAQIEENSDEPLIIVNDTTATIIDTTVSVDTDTTSRGLEKEPELKTFVKASYPDSLIAAAIEGAVSFELLINETGKVDSIKVIKSLHPTLDSLARAAVSQFQFTPGIADGNPVPVSLVYDYHFTLEEIITEIEEYTNIKGIILEKGTRVPLSDVMLSITMKDIATDLQDSCQTVVTRSGILPAKRYFDKIGSFAGQSLEDRSIITTTDSAGNFSFKSIPAGRAKLKVVATGYEPYYSMIEVSDSEVISIIIRINKIAIDDFEITVYGKAQEKEIVQRTLQAREAKRVPGFSGDAVKAVQALPGVARPVFGSTEIVLRGADWDDNKYYIDGVEVPYLWHDLGNNSVINSNIVDIVELFPSSFGAKYGDALGGVINVNTRKAQERTHVIADISTGHASLVLDLPINRKLSFVGSMRREYFMSLVALMLKQFDAGLDFKMYYWDYSLRMDYKPSNDHTIFCEFLEAKDILEFTDDEEKENSLEYKKGFKLGILGWDWAISKTWSNTFRYGLTPLSNVARFEEEKYKVSGYEHTVRDELKWKISEKLNATAGLDLHLEPTDMEYRYKGQIRTRKNLTPRDTTINNKADFLNGSVGGYVSVEYNPIEKLTIKPEYRIDYYPGLNYHGSLLPEIWDYESKPEFRWSHEPSVRLSTRYQLSKNHLLKSSAGTYNKSPGFDVMEEFGGNPLLEPARGSQYTLGYEWQISDLISLDVSGYINRQWDKSHFVDEFERGDGYDVGTLVNRGKARMKGIEVFLRHNQSKRFSGWLSYSLSYSERYNYKEKEWIVFDRNILNNLQLVSSLNLRRNMNIGLRFQYTNGYPYTPAKKVLYYDASNFYYVPEWGSSNSKKHTPYLELDLRFEKKKAFKRSIITYYVGCDRIFHFLQFKLKDNGEPLYLPSEFPTYNYDYSKFEGFANFPEPSFGLSIEF
ncbi:MAG: TonB-dependent receptor [Chitinispirillaceae bacterium]|nr:TonB-dependent receptor [Chitinispirillaceae bacterium]